MNTAAQKPLLEAHRALSEAFRLLDGTLGLLSDLEYAAGLDARDGIARARKQVRVLALFSGIPPADVGP